MKFHVKIGPGGITYDSSTGQLVGQEIRSFFRMAPGITNKDDEGIIDTLTGLAVDWKMASEDEAVQETVQESQSEQEPAEEKPKKKKGLFSKSKDDEK